MDDFAILQKVLDGDREAFAELIERYQSRVQGLCMSLLLDRAEAEDAAQDVFIKVFSSLSSYRKDASFSAWIHRITSNHCMDVLRKRKRRKTDSLDHLLDAREDGGSASAEPTAAATEDPGSVSNDARELAGRVLAELPPDQRELLVLREIEGLRYDEIAEALNCSVEAVRARLHRARLLLQEKARHVLASETSDK